MNESRRDSTICFLPAARPSRRALFGALAGGVLSVLTGHPRVARAQVISPFPEPEVVACDPFATSGVAGLVLIGPMCPVVTLDDPCPDRPFAATIVIQDAWGQEVCTAWSGEDGRFRAGLAPGDYLLVPLNGEAGLPYASPLPVTVAPDFYTEVTVSYDSGIR